MELFLVVGIITVYVMFWRTVWDWLAPHMGNAMLILAGIPIVAGQWAWTTFLKQPSLRLWHKVRGIRVPRTKAAKPKAIVWRNIK